MRKYFSLVIAVLLSVNLYAAGGIPFTGSVSLDQIEGSGTRDNTTFLRGDGTFATPTATIDDIDALPGDTVNDDLIDSILLDPDLRLWAGITPGTGVGTALGVNVGSAGAFVTNGGALGTPASGTLTNCTFPTLNQNTSGSAASMSISGQSGRLSFTGLTSSNRTKTVRDAADTILELGGSYTPTGTWNLGSATITNAPTWNQNTSGTAAGLSATLGASRGGTGVANNAANTITFSGNYGLTLTLSNTTSVTLPTSGTLLAAGNTLRTGSGTSLPGTCTVGEMYLDTDADTNGSLYTCVATNTWKEVDDDGGAGGMATTDIDTSAELYAIMTDETGSASGTPLLVFNTNPTLTGLTLAGDVTQTGAAYDWDMVDNNASALSFDAAGKAGILEIVTTDSAEGVKMSGTLTVTGAITANGGITAAASAAPTSTQLDSDAPGTDKEISKQVGGYVDGADGAENGTYDLYVHEAGTSTSYVQLDGKNTRIEISKSLVPSSSDGAALGTGTLMFSDLFLASGAVINFNNVDVTLTHSSDTLTLGGGNLALGANNLTTTGSIGATGARATKVWATDSETTNIPTVGGTPILSSLTAPQLTTIELGHASDTTFARVSAGLASIEGNPILVSSLSTNNVDVANSVWGASNGLVFEGATADAYETTVTVTDPTADRTITLQNSSGTLEFTAATQTGSHASADTTNPLSPTWTGAMHTVWYGATGTINLPAASTYSGRGILIYNTGAYTITVDSNGSEVIVRDGTAQTGGVSMTLSSGAGNFVYLLCDGTRWVTMGYKGTLAQGS